MLRLKINQKTWYDHENMLKPHKLDEYKHIGKVIVPFQGYGLIFHSFPLFIGREIANHIVLDDPTVSRRHAIIMQHDDKYYIKDLNSKAGTRVSDGLGRAKECIDGKFLIIPDDQIVLGETVLELLHPKEVF